MIGHRRDIQSAMTMRRVSMSKCDTVFATISIPSSEVHSECETMYHELFRYSMAPWPADTTFMSNLKVSLRFVPGHTQFPTNDHSNLEVTRVHWGTWDR